MILGSSQYLINVSELLLTRIKVLMEKVCTYNPVDIRAYEIKEGLVWGTFLPYMGYLYQPQVEDTMVETAIKELKLLGFKILLHSLNNALGREDHVKILVNEGLLDYLIALLWYVPSCCTYLARNVIKDVSKHTQLKPPSLSSLAKAKLAKDVMGLKKVMSMQSVSDLFV